MARRYVYGTPHVERTIDTLDDLIGVHRIILAEYLRPHSAQGTAVLCDMLVDLESRIRAIDPRWKATLCE